MRVLSPPHLLFSGEVSQTLQQFAGFLNSPPGKKFGGLNVFPGVRVKSIIDVEQPEDSDSERRHFNLAMTSSFRLLLADQHFEPLVALVGGKDSRSLSKLCDDAGLPSAKWGPEEIAGGHQMAGSLVSRFIDHDLASALERRASPALHKLQPLLHKCYEQSAFLQACLVARDFGAGVFPKQRLAELIDPSWATSDEQRLFIGNAEVDLRVALPLMGNGYELHWSTVLGIEVDGRQHAGGDEDQSRRDAMKDECLQAADLGPLRCLGYEDELLLGEDGSSYFQDELRDRLERAVSYQRLWLPGIRP